MTYIRATTNSTTNLLVSKFRRRVSVIVARAMTILAKEGRRTAYQVAAIDVVSIAATLSLSLSSRDRVELFKCHCRHCLGQWFAIITAVECGQ